MGPTLATHEANPADDARALAYVVNSRREGIYSVRLAKVKRERIEEGPLDWVAFKNKYFLLVALKDSTSTEAGFGGVVAQPTNDENAAALTATLPIGRKEPFSFSLYIGPQEHDRLRAVGQQLEDVNPYGWRFLRPIIRPLGHFITWCVIQLHNSLGLSYGAVLILFGILVRVVLWPLNSKAMRSQMKNMEIQPKLKEIQTRYKNDPEKLQKEMMRLYKEEGFNPFGGCLPMLLPFPVLITLFFVFQSTILFRGVSFMWLPDLSRHDPLYILPVLLGASMFVMQWLSLRATPQPNPQMKMMMWFMPGMMMVIFLKLASGLNLYYAASTLASIPQQLQIMKERKDAQTRIAQKGTAPA
jgi:YidC/Oxa1 family membrane protein insertase